MFTISPLTTKFAGILVLSMVLVVSALSATSPANSDGANLPALRWAEGEAGCTFTADQDGKYRYGLWTADFGIIVAVDSQELQKASRRTEPVFALLLAARYRGKDSMILKPSGASLEFVNHYHEVHPVLDPEELAARFQEDAARFVQETERAVRKHPAQKAEREARLLDHQKNVADMLEFLKTRSLRQITLDVSHPDADGWILFSVKSKWIGDWKKREEFVLRVPLAGRMLEFPFALPPSHGDLLLRRR